MSEIVVFRHSVLAVRPLMYLILLLWHLQEPASFLRVGQRPTWRRLRRCAYPRARPV